MKSETTIYVIDDDPGICDLFSEALGEQYAVKTFSTGKEGLKEISESPPDILILDLRLPEKGGLDVLREVKDEYPGVEVVMVTAHKDVKSAVEAMKTGAYDYVVKPFDVQEIEVIIQKVLENRDLKKEVKQLRSHFRGNHPHTPLVGESQVMDKIREQISKVATTDTSVLVRGASGTGKEVVSNTIHHQSDRADAPFVAVNCAAIPENLLESELFGHKQGAFTGADQDKKGKVQLAEAGTLFLDEIGALPTDMQAKLLRVLQNREITPVGGEKPVTIDFRLICATSSDLEAMIEEDTFREDLFYRINVFEMNIPPLRERPRDIPPLCEFFLEEINKKLDRTVEGISDAALDQLRHYHWPGNVRELRNALESAAVVGETPVLKPEDFDLFSDRSRSSGDHSEIQAGMSLEESEAILIEKTLNEFDGNITRSAEQLGITRKTLRSKKDKYGIELENKQ